MLCERKLSITETEYFIRSHLRRIGEPRGPDAVLSETLEYVQEHGRLNGSIDAIVSVRKVASEEGVLWSDAIPIVDLAPSTIEECLSVSPGMRKYERKSVARILEAVAKQIDEEDGEW